MVFIDSGADENFIDASLAAWWEPPFRPLTTSLVANALNGKKLADVTHVSIPVTLVVSGNHHEQIQLHRIESPHAPVVLGCFWFGRHNPQTDWVNNKILGWNPFCLPYCLFQAHMPLHPVLDPPGKFPDLSTAP